MERRGLLEGERPEHYPRRHAPAAELPLHLTRHVPVRPARFLVGVSAGRGLYPPKDKVKGTPLQAASYVARVEEVSEAGEVTVTLWERPNGREGLTTLSVTEHLEGKAPSVGDLLWIWTWMDATRNGPNEGEPRIHVEVEPPGLDEADRERLRELVRKLEGAP